MSRFLAGQYRNLKAYEPGEQPQDQKYIKLNTNESPYPPAPAVLDALSRQECALLNLYPDPDAHVLRSKLAELYGVGKNNVIVSNGSDEILSWAFMAYGSMGVCFPDITYGFYPVYGDLLGYKYTIHPLNNDFGVDINDYRACSGLVVIANPNAPTGLLLSTAQIAQLLQNNPDAVVLIDEAYIDFGGVSSCSLIDKYDNLLVVQTFSKSRGLAGGRLGFAVANEQIITDLNTLRCSLNPYNVNRLTLTAGTAALAQNDYYMYNCREIIATRTSVQQQLKALGFVCTDSHANFIFTRYQQPDLLSGRQLYEQLRKRGLLVRHFDKPRIVDYVRVTVGTPDQMQAFVTALQDIVSSIA